MFQSFLNVHHTKAAQASSKKKPPLFKIVASLAASDIVTSPAMGEIQATLSKVMRNIIETTTPGAGERPTHVWASSWRGGGGGGSGPS